DGIRDRNVTGVQTCALPISDRDDGFDIGDLSSLSQNRHRGLPRTARHIYESHVRDGDRVVPLAPNAGFLLYWLSGCNVFAGSKAETKDYRYKNRSEEHTSELQSRFDLV